MRSILDRRPRRRLLKGGTLHQGNSGVRQKWWPVRGLLHGCLPCAGARQQSNLLSTLASRELRLFGEVREGGTDQG